MEKKNHLPIYGVGPVYVTIIIILTILGMFLSKNVLLSGHYLSFHILVNTLAIVIILCGLILWIKAYSTLGDNIQKNKLVTNGVYSLVRNPIYSAFLIMCTGVLLLAHNFWVLLFPIVYWLLLMIMLRCTEEKWLQNLYGEEYQAYCRKTNRCIPWFPKK